MRARIAASAAPSVTAGSTRCASAGARHRQPAELHREHDRQQRAQPEVRHRDAGERERHRGLIDRAPAIQRARRCRAAPRSRSATTIAATASCGGRPSRWPISRADRRAVAKRRAEIAAHEPGQEVAVLRQQRLIETELARAGPRRRRRGADSPSIACAGSPGTRWISANTSVATPSSTGTVSSNRRTRYRAHGPGMMAATRLVEASQATPAVVAVLEPEPLHRFREALTGEAQLDGPRRDRCPACRASAAATCPPLEHAPRGVERQHARRRRRCAPGQHLRDMPGADAPARRRRRAPAPPSRSAARGRCPASRAAQSAPARRRRARRACRLRRAAGRQNACASAECPRRARATAAAGCERPPDETAGPREIARGRLRRPAAGWSPPARGRRRRAARSRRRGESRAPAATRSSLACARGDSSLTSSRKQRAAVRLLEQARRAVPIAPVNAPRAWPNSSASTSSSVSAAQLTAQKRRSRRGLSRCSARATSSFPVPLSPSISTGKLVTAARAIASRTAAIAGLAPRISGASDCPAPATASASSRARIAGAHSDARSAAPSVNEAAVSPPPLTTAMPIVTPCARTGAVTTTRAPRATARPAGAVDGVAKQIAREIALVDAVARPRVWAPDRSRRARRRRRLRARGSTRTRRRSAESLVFRVVNDLQQRRHGMNQVHARPPHSPSLQPSRRSSSNELVARGRHR